MTDAELAELMDRFDNGFPWDQEAVVTRLKLEPSGDIVERLLFMQASVSRRRADVAFLLLLRLNSQAALRHASLLIASSDDADRYFAYANIGNHPSPTFIPLLVNAAFNESCQDARYRAVEALGNCATLSEIPLLKKIASTDLGTDFEGRPISEMARIGVELTRMRFATDRSEGRIAETPNSSER
jgi:predicted NAD/FAD-binding protein